MNIHELTVVNQHHEIPVMNHHESLGITHLTPLPAAGPPQHMQMQLSEGQDFKCRESQDFKCHESQDFKCHESQDFKCHQSQDFKCHASHDFKCQVNIITESPPDPPPAPADIKPKLDKKKKEAIDGQAREVIFKVIKFFESEKQNRGYTFPVENVVKRACAATGLSESTIKRIKRDGLRAEATQTKMTGPKKRRVRKTKVQLDYYQLCSLRGIVNSYSVRKEVPTLGKILAAARSELNYTGGKESLRLILLNKLGIKFKKCEKKNKKPPEQPPQQQPLPQMNSVMPLPMQHLKPMDNQCVYTNTMLTHVPVSY